MRIINTLPPFWNKILAAGMRPDPKNTVATYGDILYNPGCHEISTHLMAHEETHTVQQGDSPDAWWDKYLKDPKFRLEQEIEAYANQYASYCKKQNRHERQWKYLVSLAEFLSGRMYDNLLSLEEAMEIIKRNANV